MNHNRIEKHLQCEKLLGLAGGNTKKHGNKKSGECITPIRYNVLHMYITSGFPCYLVVVAICHIGGRVTYSLHRVHALWGTIMIIDCAFCASYSYKYNVRM